jgi:hypothetical protein
MELKFYCEGEHKEALLINIILVGQFVGEASKRLVSIIFGYV